MRNDPTDPQTWLTRARSNLKRAELGRQDPAILFEDLCFDAQQAAEKALKAICVHRQIPFERVHSLVYLTDLLEQAGLTLPQEVKRADELTAYAVEGRYPGFAATVEEAEYRAAVQLARLIVRWAEEVIEGS